MDGEMLIFTLTRSSLYYECVAQVSGYMYILFHETLAVNGMINNDFSVTEGVRGCE